MDAKVTLSFDAKVIEKAKVYAEKQGISLSRLMEVLLRQLLAEHPARLEDFTVSGWVSMVAEGQATYRATPRSNKELREEMRASKK
jgi:antitoxin component of RelBE/YafQ-DinJ toxin-antitoxin module